MEIIFFCARSLVIEILRCFLFCMKKEYLKSPCFDLGEMCDNIFRLCRLNLLGINPHIALIYYFFEDFLSRSFIYIFLNIIYSLLI